MILKYNICTTYNYNINFNRQVQFLDVTTFRCDNV